MREQTNPEPARNSKKRLLLYRMLSRVINRQALQGDSLNMKKKTKLRCLIAASILTASGLSPAQAQLQLPPLLLAATGQVSGVVLTPALMATIGASPTLWNSLINVATPYMAPYSEELRQLAIKKAPRLRPVAAAPTPAAQVFANSYSQIFSFGDSMSDTGNLYAQMRANGGGGLPTSPNYAGRFSNGPVVLEAMANALNLPLVNYAFAGARSGTGNLVPVYGMQKGMLNQIQDLLDNQPTSTSKLDANALYVLWTGPDDYYSDGNVFNPAITASIIGDIQQGMIRLYQRGARHFFVPQMPDLSITPSAHNHNNGLGNYLVNAKARSAEMATALDTMLQNFARSYPLATVHTFETYTYSQTRLTQAAAEGFNVTEACYNPKFLGIPGPVCDKPDLHLFWDGNHPTKAGSIVIGTDFAKALVNNAPFPSR